MRSPYIAPESWFNANLTCTQMGAHLVSIHDNSTQWLLSHSEDVGLQHGVLSFWIGLNVIGAIRGSYSWSDGTALDFTRWSVGEPNDKGGRESCVELVMKINNMEGHHFHWNDRHCTDKRPFICSAMAGTLPGRNVFC